MKCDVTLVYDGEMTWIDNYDIPFRFKYNVVGEINSYRIGWAHFNIGIWESAPDMSDALCDLLIEIKKKVNGQKSRYELRFCPVERNGVVPVLLNAIYERAGIGSIVFVIGENKGWERRT